MCDITHKHKTVHMIHVLVMTSSAWQKHCGTLLTSLKSLRLNNIGEIWAFSISSRRLVIPTKPDETNLNGVNII